MALKRALVLEVNELPRRVLEMAVEQGIAPNLAQMLDKGGFVETEVREELPREMYPSQTWASFGTGRPWSSHNIWWYHDEKRPEFPFYWQTAAANGKSVGLVNVLHSSPLDERFDSHLFPFVVPDCFASTPDARPQPLESFQRLNLRLTSANSRKTDIAGSNLSPRDLVALRHIGLSARTVGAVGSLITQVATGRVPKERLRTGQFLLLKDMFLRLVRTHQPDLGVLFTNHVAAAMHRYWYASFPQDFAAEWYDEEWVQRYRDEIPNAMSVLDSFVGELLDLGALDGYEVILASSMGQTASGLQAPGATEEAVVTEPLKFLKALGLPSATIVQAMTPQVSIQVNSKQEATDIVQHLDQLQTNLAQLDVDISERTITLTYAITTGQPLVVDGIAVSLASAGVTEVEVDDHSSGRHTARGILLSSLSMAGQPEVIDYLDASSLLLSRMGIETDSLAVSH